MGSTDMSEQGSQSIAASGTSHAQFLEEVIYAALSPVFGGRIYPGVAPDNTGNYTYAVQTTPSDVPNDTLADGRNVSNPLIQLDIYAATREAARTAGELTKTAMDALVSATMGVTLQRTQTLYDPGVRLHRIIHEYSFLLPRNGGTS